jgi:hypothetical protein
MGARLLECRAARIATIVFGRVQVVYSDGPTWLTPSAFDPHPAFRRGACGSMDTACTCNVSLNRAA